MPPAPPYDIMGDIGIYYLARKVNQNARHGPKRLDYPIRSVSFFAVCNLAKLV